jgi:hypothetical protein
MASLNYQDSTLLAAVGLLDKKFNEKELRKPVYGATQAFVDKREILIPSHREIWKSEAQVLTAKFLERDARAIANARTCTPIATLRDSGTQDISWTTYAQTFTTSVKIFENNEYSQQQQLANDMYNVFMDLYDQIENDAVAYLEANRTTVQGLRTLNTWDGVNDVMNVANADRDNYLNYVKTEFFAEDYRQTIKDIHSINMMAMYRQQYAQGASNDENLVFQFPGFEHYPSYQVTDATGDVFGTSYFVEEGGIALLDWIPFLNRRGQKSEAGHIWTTMPDPFGFPFTWAVFIIDDCADTSFANTGNTQGATQDYVRVYEISLDLSFNHAPLTAAGETVIMKYALLSA